MASQRLMARWPASALIGACVIIAEPALAQGGFVPARQAIQASAADMLVLAQQLAGRGQVDQAERILDLLARDPSREVRNEARFRQSAILEAQGRNRESALLLRRILDDKPDAAAVRLKLATMLQAIGDEDAALRELRALRSSDLPPNVARFVDRLSASLQASKPLGFQLEIALAPDSNINRATRSDSLGTVFGDFTLEEDSQARSGIGAALRGLAQARHAFSDDFGLTARASGEASLYRHKQFNEIALELAGGPEWRLGRTRLSAEGGIGHQWYGMKPFQRSLRLTASATHPIDPVSQLRVDATARWLDNRFNDLQDGRDASLRARYERALSPSLLVAGYAGMDRFKAREDAYSTRSWNLGLTGYRDVGRMTVSAGIEIGGLRADDRLALLPEAREDKVMRLSLGTVFRQFTVAGFAPVTRLVFERNKSSVEFHDYQRTRTEFGISRAF